MKTEFRSAHYLAVTTTVLLIVDIVCNFLEIVYNFVYVAYFPNLGDSTNLGGGELAMTFGALALIVLKFTAFIATAVVFLMWLYRAYGNLSAFNVQSLKASPGWAVGYWFIPIANLFKPLQAVNEVYNGSDEEQMHDGFTFSNTATPSLLGFWWACWLISSFTARASSAMENAAKDITNTSILVYVISLAFSIMAGLLLVTIVRETDRRQASRERALMPSAPPPPPMFAQGDMSGGV